MANADLSSDDSAGKSDKASPSSSGRAVECRVRSEPRQGGMPGRFPWRLGQHRINAHQVERYCREDMLEVGPGQAHVARTAQPHHAHGFGQGAFNPRPERITLTD